MSKLADKLKERIRREYAVSILTSGGSEITVSTSFVALFREKMTDPSGANVFDIERDRQALEAEHGTEKANSLIAEKLNAFPFHSIHDFRGAVLADKELVKALSDEVGSKAEQEAVIDLYLWASLPEWIQSPVGYKKTFGHLPADIDLYISSGEQRRRIRA
jgi:hypothetical protein